MLDDGWLRIIDSKERFTAQIEVTYEDAFGGKYIRRAHMSFCGDEFSAQYPPHEGNDEVVLIDTNAQLPRPVGLIPRIRDALKF